MNDSSVFHLISDITKQKGVACVLIGGFAVNHYKVSRQTGDVDLLITKEDFDKIIGLIEKAGYKKIFSHENFAQYQSSHLSLMDVDFMFVESDTLKKILKESEEFAIVGQKFFVPSLFHLIALKLHCIKFNPKNRMSKDWPDIMNLIRVNDVDVKEKKFKELCLKFGNENIYQKILEERS